MKDLPNGKIDKVCIHQDVIGWTQLCVVLEKERRIRLFDMLGRFLLFLFFNLLFGFFRVRLNACILGANDFLRNGEFASLFGLAHGEMRTRKNMGSPFFFFNSRLLFEWRCVITDDDRRSRTEGLSLSQRNAHNASLFLPHSFAAAFSYQVIVGSLVVPSLSPQLHSY